jgi:hypothetical protein
VSTRARGHAIVLGLLLACCHDQSLGTEPDDAGSVPGPQVAEATPVRVQVKLGPRGSPDAPLRSVPEGLRARVVKVEPLFSIAAPEAERIGAERLRAWFVFTLQPGTDPAVFAAELQQLETIEVAEPAPSPAPPPAR